MPSAITPTASDGSGTPASGHILYVDAFDSFSNNIVGLLEQSLDVTVTVVRIDDDESARNLLKILAAFDAVVVGPGPGHPAIPSDVGLINRIWELADEHLLPVLGICLGFQSLSLAHGARIVKLRQARHGLVNRVFHSGSDIFGGVGELHATQYHSLHVDLGASVASRSPRWEPTKACPLLRPLAWDLTDEINGPILMGIRHTEKPFWGVQFHPESICTSKEGAEMIQNWWSHAQAWCPPRRMRVNKTRLGPLGHLGRLGSVATPSSFPVAGEKAGLRYEEAYDVHEISHLAQEVQSITGTRVPLLRWAKHPTARVTPVALCEALGLQRDEIVMLDSQGHSSGRFSIIGVVVPGQTMKVSYRSWDRTLRYSVRSTDEFKTQLDSIDQLWPMLQETLDLHDPGVLRNRSPSPDSEDDDQPIGMDTCVRGYLPDEIPFWGGWMGYVSYEAGLETIRVDLHESCAESETPDVNFAFIHRSIVIDHVAGKTYVQSLSADDWSWILLVGRTIDGMISRMDLRANNLRDAKLEDWSSRTRIDDGEAALERCLRLATVSKPDEYVYRQKVLDCQDELAAGDSYELCLTDETVIQIPRVDGAVLDPWCLYKKLRRKNPAPFGAFLRLSNANVVGTSPERFLHWDRDGHFQLRPIKGTVKKSPGMTWEKAHQILNTSKERAENLMIVDLVRHDISGVIGAENCSVPKLMVVEEYESVFQLVSVIEGQAQKSPFDQGARGLDVLKASLPPGSMTGAPKKRSCEILRDIEKRPRGIYSGVLGYMDIGGGGDFSVVIRTVTCRNRRAAGNHAGVETCRIGAGGAVTIQSTDDGEFQEMETKLASALKAFQGGSG